MHKPISIEVYFMQNLKVYIARFVEYPLQIITNTFLVRIINEILISVRAISISKRYVDKQRNISMKIKNWILKIKKKDSRKISSFNRRRMSVKNKIK